MRISDWSSDVCSSDLKAWQLIDAAGCRGLTIGGAMVSDKHCNFLTNTGTATAADLENLGEEVRRRVKASAGITQIGRAAGRERGGQYVEISGVAVDLKTKHNKRDQPKPITQQD